MAGRCLLRTKALPVNAWGGGLVKTTFPVLVLNGAILIACIDLLHAEKNRIRQTVP